MARMHHLTSPSWPQLRMLAVILSEDSVGEAGNHRSGPWQAKVFESHVQHMIIPVIPPSRTSESSLLQTDTSFALSAIAFRKLVLLAAIPL